MIVVNKYLFNQPYRRPLKACAAAPVRGSVGTSSLDVTSAM